MTLGLSLLPPTRHQITNINKDCLLCWLHSPTKAVSNWTLNSPLRPTTNSHFAISMIIASHLELWSSVDLTLLFCAFSWIPFFFFLRISISLVMMRFAKSKQPIKVVCLIILIGQTTLLWHDLSRCFGFQRIDNWLSVFQALARWPDWLVADWRCSKFCSGTFCSGCFEFTEVIKWT